MMSTHVVHDAPTAPVLAPGRPIRLGVPFSMYRLHISHRLLDHLGAVSRFLLHALAQGATFETICSVTALSPATITAQCDYLRYQGYLGDGMALAALGQEMVELAALLPQCVVDIGVDNFCGKNIFVLPVDAPAPTVVAPDATLPEARHVRQYDHQGRVGEILLDNDGKGLLNFLNYFWEPHSTVFAQQLRYLDCRLEPLPGHPAARLTVSIDSSKLVPVTKLAAREVGVVLPVLDVARHGEPVPDWPWPVTLPAPDRHRVDLFSLGLLDDGLPVVDATDDARRVLGHAAPDGAPALPALSVPAGVQIRYTAQPRFLHLRLAGSLMAALRADHGYLILGDADA